MVEPLPELPPRLLLLGAGYTGQRLLNVYAEAELRSGAGSSGTNAFIGTMPGFASVTAWRSADWNLDAAHPLPARDAWTHLAYLVPPPGTGETDPRLEHALGTLLGRTAALRRVVYLSTTGVYGDAGGGTR